jgi:hypothetical protein
LDSCGFAVSLTTVREVALELELDACVCTVSLTKVTVEQVADACVCGVSLTNASGPFVLVAADTGATAAPPTAGAFLGSSLTNAIPALQLIADAWDCTVSLIKIKPPLRLLKDAADATAAPTSAGASLNVSSF